MPVPRISKEDLRQRLEAGDPATVPVIVSPILNQALGYEQPLPARKTREIEQVLAACPELEFIIDGTERPIQPPKERQRQQDNYSGKKKRPTVKNNVISHKPTKKIKALSPTEPGKLHDKKLADQEQYRFPAGSKLWKDTGFQGYEPDGGFTYQPKKKPKGGELTAAEKEENQAMPKNELALDTVSAG